MNLLTALERYAKAIAALVVAGYGLYNAATMEGTPGGAGITADEWVGIVFTAILAGAAVWGIPNGGSASLPPPPVATTTSNPSVVVVDKDL
jgi:hypothetical protein